MALFENVPITKDVRLVRDGSKNEGAGHDPYSDPVGRNSSTGERNRVALLPAFRDGFWADKKRIQDAWLYVCPADWKRVDQGSTPRSRVRLITQSWKQGGKDTPSEGNTTVWPGPEVTTDGEVTGATWLKEGGGSYPPNPANFVYVRISIVDLFMQWAPAGTLGPAADTTRGLANYGLLLAAVADDWTDTPSYTTTVGNVEFRLATAVYPPYLRVQYLDNLPPRAPTVFAPKGGSPAPVVTTASGLILPTSHSLSDPDLGATDVPGPKTDHLTGADYEVYLGTTTDVAITNGTATPIVARHQDIAGNVADIDYDIPIPDRFRNTEMKWRVADYDKRNVLGAWLAPQLVLPNARPTVEADQVHFQTSYTPDATISPAVTARPDDPDGFVFAVTRSLNVVIQRLLSNGEVVVMTPPDNWIDLGGGSAASDVASNSGPLQPGVRYRGYVQVRDANGAVSAGPGQAGFMGYKTFTPKVLQGPDHLSPITATYKHLSRRPTINIGNSVQWNAYRWTWTDAVSDDGLTLAGNTLYDSPIVTASPSLGGGFWDLSRQYPAAGTAGAAGTLPAKLPHWGDELWWTVEVRLLDGTWTGRSVPHPAVIDTLPDAPFWNLQMDAGTFVPLFQDTVTVSDTLDPIVRVPFSDPDKSRRSFDEKPVWRRVGIKYTDNTTRAQIFRRLYAYEDVFPLASLLTFKQPAALTPSNSGWTPGAGTHVLSYSSGVVSADFGSEYGGTSLVGVVTAQPASTVVDAGPDAAALVQQLDGSAATVYTNLSGVASLSIWRRVDGTLTNLGSLRLRVYCGSLSDWRDYAIATSGTTTGSVQKVTLNLASPTAVSGAGAHNLATVSGYALVTIATGALSFVYWVADLRIAGLLVSQTTYRLTSRYIDDNSESAWGNVGTVQLKASKLPTLTWGTKPDSADATPSLPVRYTGETALASIKLELLRRRGEYDLMAQRPGSLLFWPMDEASGTTANDRGVLTNRPGTITGSPTLGAAGITGDGRTGITFGGINKYITRADETALRPAAITFAVLLRITTLADFAVFVRKTDGGSGSWFLRTEGTGATHRALAFYVRTGASLYTKIGRWPADGTDPPLNTWLTAICTYDGTGGRFWISWIQIPTDAIQYDPNGLVTTDPTAGAAIVYSSPGALEVGVRGAAASVRMQMFEPLNRGIDAIEAQAIVDEISETLRNQLTYVGPDTPTTAASGDTVTLAVPTGTLLDDATYIARVTATDSDGLQAVLT